MKNKSGGIVGFVLLILFFVGFYLNSHKEGILGLCADYYFKRGNLQKAQEYYEKAFDLGLDNSKQREIYVNSIINSPLTVKSQEKLVKFLENPKSDVARVKAEYFLADFKREVHRKFSGNYISNAVFNQKIIRWSSLPITYTFKNREKAPNYYVREIENAFTEWEKAMEHQIQFAEDDINPNIIIDFEELNPAGSNDKKYVVAYTTPKINIDSLQNMEIVFYINDPQGKEYTENQVYNTALHEIAHSLGFMGHSNERDNIMYLTKDSLSEYKDIREELSEADINTLKLLYKIKPQITNVDVGNGDYLSNLVLGSELEINSEKIREAKIYIKNAPDLPAGYIDLAEGLVQQKDYVKAIKSLKKALRLADTDEIRGMIYYNLAVTNFYLDSLAEAQDYLLKSLQYDDSEEKHYLLGEIYAREGNIQGAIKEFSDLIRKNPKNIEYTVALTNIYVLNRDYIKARQVLKVFFKTNPTEKNNPRFKPYGILRFGL